MASCTAYHPCFECQDTCNKGYIDLEPRLPESPDHVFPVVFSRKSTKEVTLGHMKFTMRVMSARLETFFDEPTKVYMHLAEIKTLNKGSTWELRYLVCFPMVVTVDLGMKARIFRTLPGALPNQWDSVVPREGEHMSVIIKNFYEGKYGGPCGFD
ncbi:hypothetical protein BJX99DRAFT_253972 [Aspergillus californicus]